MLSRGHINVVGVLASLAFGCALPHPGQGPQDTAPQPDVVSADGRDVGNDLIAVSDVRDVVAPDVPSTADVTPPTDVPPPSDIVAMDVPPPMDVQPDVAPATLPPGSACTPGASPMCAAGSDCFAYVSGTFCALCGGYGERPCAGNTCTEGMYSVFGDTCIYPFGTNFGQPGGACAHSNDCGMPGQCYPVGGGYNACLACGGVGQACCCGAHSCSCLSGLTCVLNANTGTWTLCR